MRIARLEFSIVRRTNRRTHQRLQIHAFVPSFANTLFGTACALFPRIHRSTTTGSFICPHLLMLDCSIFLADVSIYGAKGGGTMDDFERTGSSLALYLLYHYWWVLVLLVFVNLLVPRVRGEAGFSRMRSRREASGVFLSQCPRCDSTDLLIGKRGWTWKAGLFGSGKMAYTCINCGFKFDPAKYAR